MRQDNRVPWHPLCLPKSWGEGSPGLVPADTWTLGVRSPLLPTQEANSNISET